MRITYPLKYCLSLTTVLMISACGGSGSNTQPPANTTDKSPASIKAEAINTSSIKISWVEPSPTKIPNTYEIISNNRVIGTTEATEFVDTSAEGNETKCYFVTYKSSDGVISPISNKACATTPIIYSKVSVGIYTACAISTPDGRAYCWGQNKSGTLGQASAIQEGGISPIPTKVPIHTDFIDIDTSDDEVCAVKKDGTVWCWGQTNYGSVPATAMSTCGISTCGPYVYNSSVKGTNPVQVGTSIGLKNAVWVSVGQGHACVSTKNKQAYCWGINKNGQLGNGNTDDVPITAPTLVYGFTGISGANITSGTQVHTMRAYANATCIIDDLLSTYCFGQLRDTPVTPLPTLQSKINSSGKHYLIATGNFGSCLYRPESASGTLSGIECVGTNSFGSLGIDNTAVYSAIPVAVPTKIPAGGIIKSLSAGLDSICAVSENIGSTNIINCWGDNHFGQTGTTPSYIEKPHVVIIDVAPASISTSGTTTCALTKAGSIYCWGDGSLGQLGDGLQLSTGARPPRFKPAPIALPRQVS